mgnify:CR=1 FL=1
MRWLKVLLILCILAGLLVAAVKVVHFRQQELESVQAPQKPARPVHTAKISTDTLQVTQTYRGIVRPERTVALAPRIQGRIVQIRGDAGDEVRYGQTLVRIDEAELKQNIQFLQAERQRLQSRIWILEKTYRRHKKLLQQGNLPQHELDRTLSSLEQARFSLDKTNHQLEQAKIRRDYARLEAEVDGRIQERLQEPGDTAQPGKPVLILEDGSAGYNVHVLVPAEVQRILQPGQKAVLKDGKRQQKAAIHRIHPASARGSSLMEIEIFVSSPPFDLASGASLSTELILSSVTGLVVPEQAVLSQDTGNWVFVVDGQNQIQPRQVEILARSSGRVAVKGQLHSGQEVAVGALSELMRLSPGLVAQPAGDGQS